MRVYVKNLRGEPLMPTSQGKARILLKNKRAKIISHDPFTIQLNYGTWERKQDITLGIDPGYKTVGFSAVTKKDELISGELQLLGGISKRITKRKMYRRIRRNRLRYRAPRFSNRKINKGWLAPSIQHKLDAHIKIVNLIKKILPVTKVVLEVNNFDIQKIKDPNIKGKDYQDGEKKGFYNLREYILHRDNHTCQNPKCKSKNVVLQLHHIKYRSDGGSDRPSNLITLCNKCHTIENHQKGRLLHGWKPKIKSFREATFMSMVRWRVVDRLECDYTYGYITKSKRFQLKLDKSHFNDAFCIAGGGLQNRVDPIIFKEKRKNNRSLEKFRDAIYVDIRDGKKKKGNELNCGRTTRNKNLSSENLRVYHGIKVRNGIRCIRTQRYSIRPQDIVRFRKKLYRSKGVCNRGNQVKITDDIKIMYKDIKKVELVFHKKTLFVYQEIMKINKDKQLVMF